MKAAKFQSQDSKENQIKNEIRSHPAVKASVGRDRKLVQSRRYETLSENSSHQEEEVNEDRSCPLAQSRKMKGPNKIRSHPAE